MKWASNTCFFSAIRLKSLNRSVFLFFIIYHFISSSPQYVDGSLSCFNWNLNGEHWTVLPNKCLFVSEQANQCGGMLFLFLHSKWKEKNLIGTTCMCVCDDALNFVYCERTIWTVCEWVSECETAKPRYNLWLKSCSSIFALCVCLRSCSFTHSFCTSILLICERDAYFKRRPLLSS